MRYCKSHQRCNVYNREMYGIRGPVQGHANGNRRNLFSFKVSIAAVCLCMSVHRHTAVTAHFSSDQLLLVAFSHRCTGA